MDSGNSGSMQSSSGGGGGGGDEEYDSRTESISPLFNPSINFGSISNHPHPPPPQPSLSHHQSHQPQPTMFDPQAHNLQPFSHSPPNLDLVWSRSEPNYSNLANLTGLPSFPPSSNQSLLGLNQGPTQGPFQPSGDANGRDQNQSTATTTTTVGGKNSRKRTRASRRAPTTVLTTDASNFRQMVQEFTGIPAPPFSAGSPYSRRFDLFGGGGGGLRSNHLDTLGPLYPFRPSAQKVQVQPPPSMLLNTTSTNDAHATTTTATSMAGPSHTFSSNYQMNMQNPLLSFQSLLQQSNGPTFGTKSQGSAGILSLDELGMSAQEHASANLSDQFSMQVGGTTASNRSNQHLGSFDGNGVNGGSHPQNVTGCYKMNGSGSTSDFRTGKGMGNVSSRNEGTMDSWICPSD